MNRLLNILLFLFVITYTISVVSPYYYSSPINKEGNRVINLTPSPTAEEIVISGLDILEVKGVRITLVDISNNAKFLDQGPLDLTEAFIVNPADKMYTIFFNSTHGAKQTSLILSHELIHLEQFHEGRLEVIGDTLAVFEADTVLGKDVMYLDRAWEIEAFGKQGPLSREIQKKI